jgi:predicted DNA-binding protein (MmcQ/YjbR family)
VKKRADDTLARIREICFSLPDVDETAHFGEPAFRVGKKMFATCSGKTGAWRLQLQLEPEHAKTLLGTDPRFEPYERMKNVISMQAEGVEDWDEVRALVLESYRIIARDKSKAKKRKASRSRAS